MAAYKCKMCGGNLQAAEGANHGTCDSCGTTSILPKENESEWANYQAQKLIQSVKEALNVETDSPPKHGDENYVPQEFASEKQLKRYNALLDRKAKAKSGDEFRVLAKAFAAMQGLGDSNELADECLRLADMATEK
jgi:predicted RNA-binding Zn-ribbon protein involved in translation (DUF1610 family)